MASYDAVTLEELKNALGVDGTDEDSSLARLITATTLEIEAALKTQFVQRSVIEYHEGGGKRIYPQRTPITQVTSIIDPGSRTVPSTQYVIRQQRFLEHWGHFDVAFTSAGQPTDWTVTFTAGWFASTAVVAPSVKAEIIRAIAAMREAPAAGISSVGVGDLSISYASPTAGGAVHPAIETAVNALHAYRGALL